MNTFFVDIIRKETVKPSSPTPPHLRFLKLSLIDQQEHAAPGSVLVFFSASTSASKRLRKSLPDMLTLFYPLAGRIASNEFVDCNDEGVNLFETRVYTQMTRVLSHPVDEELVELLPHDNFFKVLLSIQINIFKCGGMALGFRLSHKIADALSIMFFIKSWAASTRGCGEVEPPRFGTASFFPPKHADIPPVVSPPFGSRVKLENKRIIFSASAIAALRAKCSSKSYTPTRVEAVTAFIWSCLIKVEKSASAALMPAMNLRSRMDPPLPSSFFGNLNLGLLVTSTTNGGAPMDMAYLAAKLHQEISRVDGDYVRKLQADHGVLALYDSYAQKLNELSVKGGVSYSIITSMCRFPSYEANFGWGKPEWVTFADFICDNLTILTDTKCGTGIEARVTLREELMSRFKCNASDITAFTSKM